MIRKIEEASKNILNQNKLFVTYIEKKIGKYNKKFE